MGTRNQFEKRPIHLNNDDGSLEYGHPIRQCHRLSHGLASEELDGWAQRLVVGYVGGRLPNVHTVNEERDDAVPFRSLCLFRFQVGRARYRGCAGLSETTPRG